MVPARAALVVLKTCGVLPGPLQIPKSLEIGPELISACATVYHGKELAVDGFRVLVAKVDQL